MDLRADHAVDPAHPLNRARLTSSSNSSKQQKTR
jgi:hypothetical protein